MAELINPIKIFNKLLSDFRNRETKWFRRLKDIEQGADEQTKKQYLEWAKRECPEYYDDFKICLDLFFYSGIAEKSPENLKEYIRLRTDGADEPIILNEILDRLKKSYDGSNNYYPRCLDIVSITPSFNKVELFREWFRNEYSEEQEARGEDFIPYELIEFFSIILNTGCASALKQASLFLEELQAKNDYERPVSSKDIQKATVPTALIGKASGEDFTAEEIARILISWKDILNHTEDTENTLIPITSDHWGPSAYSNGRLILRGYGKTAWHRFNPLQAVKLYGKDLTGAIRLVTGIETRAFFG